MNRRRFVRSLAGASLVAGAWPVRSHAPAAPSDWCAGSTGEPLRVARETGWFGRITAADAPVVMRAGEAPAASRGSWSHAYACERDGRLLLNPTLVARTGDRWRIELVNALAEPTIVHWHGLTNDSQNDGGGHTLAAPGARHRYDFVVRERAGLYWYHPHPHGLTAAQVYQGLFGLIEVHDDDERALRTALDLNPGSTEMTLVLQDRAGGKYEADALDQHRGRLGDIPWVNGCVDPYVDVATRAYRLRILNAANARTFRLGVRDDAGRRVPLMLLGTDGGLLAAPVRCDECFLSPAERVDLLLDLRDARPGQRFVLETGAFDPMHTAPPPHAAVAREPPAGMLGHPEGAVAARLPQRAHDRWPEGAARALLAFRVRRRVAYRRPIPSRLSRLDPLDTAGARERPLRLGFNKARWRINDRVFAMDETPIEVARDSTEVWLLRNYHTSMPHAMHLHGFHFQVLERETSPDVLAPLATHSGSRLATDLGWKDTLLVWPGESVRIAIRFALPFTGAQTYLLHCHNLEHEDGGMMLGVKVA